MNVPFSKICPPAAISFVIPMKAGRTVRPAVWWLMQKE
jgi:hypothetical protein